MVGFRSLVACRQPSLLQYTSSSMRMPAMAVYFEKEYRVQYGAPTDGETVVRSEP